MKSYKSYFLDDHPSARAFDVFEPETVSHRIVLFFIHGGGWWSGSRSGEHALMWEFSKRGYLCASTDYRLIPEGVGAALTALDQLSDVRDTYTAFLELAREKQIEPLPVLFGSSAGAHLASLMATTQPGECGEPVTAQAAWMRPAAAVLQSAPFSFEPWPEIFPPILSRIQNAVGALYVDAPERYKALSLNHHIRPDNPPLLFLEGACEHIFPAQRNAEIVQQHNAWGIPSQWHIFETAEHGFFYDVTRKPQQEAFQVMCRFLDDLEHRSLS